MKDFPKNIDEPAACGEQSPDSIAQSLSYQKLLLDNASDAIYGMDANLTITYGNRAAEALFGWKTEEVIGLNSREVMITEMTLEQRRAIFSSLEENNWTTNEGVSYTKFGQRIYLEAITVKLKGEDGSLLGYAVTIHDLTQAKRKEAELISSEAKSRAGLDVILATLESIQDGFFALDREWRYTYVNQQAAQTAGMEPEQMVGNIIWELFPILNNSTVGNYYREVMETRHPARFQTEGRYSERLYEVSVFPSPTGISVYYRDKSEQIRTEQALRKAQAAVQLNLAELRSIYANSPIGLCFFDKELRYRAINEMLARMNGLPIADHIGKTVKEVLPLEVANITEQWLQQVVATGEPIAHREIIGQYRNNGLREAWLVSSHPVFDDAGELLGVSCVVQNITERKNSEEALRESEERHKRLFQNHPSPMLLSDQTGRIIDANLAACAFYGQNLEAMTAINLHDIELPAQANANTKEAEPAGDANAPRLMRHRLASGEIRDVEVHSGPITIGGQECLFSIINDITERSKTEEEIRANREDLARAQAVAQTGSWRLDVNQNALLWSEETYRIFGVPLGTPLTYEKFISMVHPEDREYVDQAWADALQGQPYDIEHRIVVGEQVKWVRERAELDLDQRGKLLGGFGTVQDITLLKHTEAQIQAYAEKLERSNQELQQFAFVASHDLQEPLRKIRMFGNSLRKRMENALPQDAEDYLNRMQNAAERMSTMINGLLELSRVNTRGGNFIPANLTPIANDVVSDLEARIQSTGGQVVIHDLPTAEVDVMQMRQLFLNLIGNALKFNKPGRPPVVRVTGTLLRSINAPVAVIVVEDNGIGFDEVYAERIFQPFQRLHGLSEYEGTGMGLAICQKIIERHQGKIKVQSKPGEGTTFIIHLPVKQG